MPENEICHFWVGSVPRAVAEQYFVETRYVDDPGLEPTPVSPFARDQGVLWYDHDFLEYGWGDDTDSVETLVTGYSYSDQWAGELSRRVAAAGLSRVNFFAFITSREIEHPRSVERDGYWLTYMGTIEYRI